MEYDVLRLLGVGGMGMVFEGRHPVIGKRVAIKVLLPQFAEEPEVLARFIDEARSVNAIRHRGIIDIFGFGQLEEFGHYIAMEYLDGSSFDALLRESGRLGWRTVLPLIDEVVDALASAHEASIIHRDIKPSNLFLVDTGRGKPYVKVLDFGVAKLLAESKGRARSMTGLVGTPHYMAPEQILGEGLGPPTDLYALGVVMFELLTGQRPFEAPQVMEVMRLHILGTPPRPTSLVGTSPKPVEALVLALMAREPRDRPTAAEIRRTISELLASAPTLPPADSPTVNDAGPTLVRDRQQLLDTGDAHTRDDLRRPPSDPSQTAEDEAARTLEPGPDATQEEDDAANSLAPLEPTLERPGVARPQTETDKLQAVERLPPEAPTRVRQPSPSSNSRLFLAVPPLMILGIALAWLLGSKPDPVPEVARTAARPVVDAGALAQVLAVELPDAGTREEPVDAGQRASVAGAVAPPPVDAGGPVAAAAVVKSPVDPLSEERLRARLGRAQVRLTKLEAERGAPDEVLRSLIRTAAERLSAHESPRARAETARLIADVEQQLQ